MTVCGTETERHVRQRNTETEFRETEKHRDTERQTQHTPNLKFRFSGIDALVTSGSSIFLISPTGLSAGRNPDIY